MEKNTIDSLLSGYLDDELSAVDRERFEAALDRQPELAERYAEIVKIQRLLQELPQTPVPEGVRQVLRKRLDRLVRKDGSHRNGTSGKSFSKWDENPKPFLQQMLHKPEQLLNAYIDDELSSKHRQQVETHLLPQGEHRQLTEQLRQTKQLVAGLDRVAAPRDLVAKVLSRVTSQADPQEPITPEEAAEDKRPFSELLSAYADGEVSSKREKYIRRKLENSPKTRKRLSEFEGCKNQLEALPRVSAPVGTVDRVMDLLKKHEPGTRPALVGEEKATSVAAKQGMDRKNRSERRHLIRTGGMLAASLLLGWAAVHFYVDDQAASHQRQLARNEMPVRTSPAPLPANSQTTIAHDVPKTREQLDELEKSVAQFNSLPDHPKFFVVALEDLKEIKPGKVIDVLNQKQVKLVCVDVERMYDRLRLVMMKNNVSVISSGDSNPVPSPANDQMYVLDISTSPDQLSGILSELWKSEQKDGALVSSIDIGKPSDELLDNVERASDAVAQTDAKVAEEAENAKASDRPAGPKLVPQIELPEQALGNLPNHRVSKALELTMPKEQPAKGKSATAAKTTKQPRVRPGKPVAEKPAPAEAEKEQNVRVLFVLEPR